MAEELKHLIEQIHKEGIDKANEQAESIISQAKEKAARIISEAEKKAYNTLQRAKSESEAFAERSVKTLEQAGRDLLITVGQGCEKVVAEVLGKEIDAALTEDVLKKMIADIAEQSTGGLELKLSESDAAKLAAYCADLARNTNREIELESDSEILSGFKAGFKNRSVYLDYTGEAVAGALSTFLRPELAKTVSGIAHEQISKA